MRTVPKVVVMVRDYRLSQHALDHMRLAPQPYDAALQACLAYHFAPVPVRENNPDHHRPTMRQHSSL